MNKVEFLAALDVAIKQTKEFCDDTVVDTEIALQTLKISLLGQLNMADEQKIAITDGESML